MAPARSRGASGQRQEVRAGDPFVEAARPSALSLQKLLINADGFFDHALLGPLGAHGLQGRFGQPARQRRIFEQAQNGACQRLRVTRRNKQAGMVVMDNLRDSTLQGQSMFGL